MKNFNKNIPKHSKTTKILFEGEIYVQMYNMCMFTLMLEGRQMKRDQILIFLSYRGIIEKYWISLKTTNTYMFNIMLFGLIVKTNQFKNDNDTCCLRFCKSISVKFEWQLFFILQQFFVSILSTCKLNCTNKTWEGFYNRFLSTVLNMIHNSTRLFNLCNRRERNPNKTYENIIASSTRNDVS